MKRTGCEDSMNTQGVRLIYNVKTDLEELLEGFKWEVVGLSQKEFLKYWRNY